MFSEPVFFDIETIPNDKALNYTLNKKQRTLEAFQRGEDLKSLDPENYYSPGNAKKPDLVERNIQQKADAEAKKAALRWHIGRVISIAYIDKEGEENFFIGEDESVVIGNFFDSLPPLATLIGKNIVNFDIPFLKGRCIALDMGLPSILKDKQAAFDIDSVFSMSARCDQTVSLEGYALGLGIEGKPHDSSMIWKYWADGDVDTIRQQNLHDCRVVREMYQRFNKPYKTVNEVFGYE